MPRNANFSKKLLIKLIWYNRHYSENHNYLHTIVEQTLVCVQECTNVEQTLVCVQECTNVEQTLVCVQECTNVEQTLVCVKV